MVELQCNMEGGAVHRRWKRGLMTDKEFKRNFPGMKGWCQKTRSTAGIEVCKGHEGQQEGLLH